MNVQRFQAGTDWPLPGAAASEGVAVVLNKNARAVTPRQVARLRRLHAADHVFLSESAAHSRTIAETIIARGYHTALLGGGDGTFMRCLNDLIDAAERAGRPLPRVGVLRMGTGNAIGYYLGVEPSTERGLSRELERAAADPHLHRPMPMLRVDGKLAPFAGTGLDSQILDDYASMTRALDALKIGPLLGSPLRYILAVALRSVPRFMLRRLPEVEVVNLGGPAYAIGPDGQPDPTPLPRGTVLYRGPCTLAAAGTVPCFGFGARLLPYADYRTDKFNLRCTDASAFETLSHLPGVLRGDYRSPKIHDFLCDAVELRLEQPVPMQIGGDIQSEWRRHMRIDLSERPVRMLAPVRPALTSG